LLSTKLYQAYVLNDNIIISKLYVPRGSAFFFKKLPQCKYPEQYITYNKRLHQYLFIKKILKGKLIRKCQVTMKIKQFLDA